MDNQQRFDEVAKDYDQLLADNLAAYGSDIAYYSEYKVKLVHRKLAGAQPARILEFGCGTGRNVEFLRQYFPQAGITGCDVSGESLDEARQHNPGVTFLLVDEVLAGSARFDLIFVAGVFHHIDPPERDKALANLRSLLTPGGNLFIFEHNPFNPLTVRAVNTCPFDEGVVLLKMSELVERAGQAGFGIRQKQYCLFFPSALKKLAPLEALLTFVPLGGQYVVWLNGKLSE